MFEERAGRTAEGGDCGFDADRDRDAPDAQQIRVPPIRRGVVGAPRTVGQLRGAELYERGTAIAENRQPRGWRISSAEQTVLSWTVRRDGGRGRRGTVRGPRPERIRKRLNQRRRLRVAP